MSLKIIKNGTIVTTAETYSAEILINGEVIEAIGRDFERLHPEAEVIDAAGKYVFPGGIDPHVHLDLPMPGTVSSDDHYTGTKAAAFGGTTTVIDFANHDCPSLVESMLTIKRKADPIVAVDYSLHQNYTRYNEETLAEIPKLLEYGVPTIKLFTAYNGRLRTVDEGVLRVLRVTKENGMMALVHAENGDIIERLIQEAKAAGHTEPIYHAETRPDWTATEATFRVCAMSELAGGAPVYIVHMNAGEEPDVLKYAQSKGIPVHGETCPQYLLFTDDELKKPDGAKWVFSPPLRKAKDNAGLWKGIQEGTIQTVATDHCPFMFDGTKTISYEGEPFSRPGKELGRDDFTKIPNGLPGVGERLIALWNYGVRAGKITMNQFVAVTSANAAKIFGLTPKKGGIQPGADADLVIWDPAKTFRYSVASSRSRTDYSYLDGAEIVGAPEIVLLRGERIVDRDRWLGRKGGGRFIPRKTSA